MRVSTGKNNVTLSCQVLYWSAKKDRAGVGMMVLVVSIHIKQGYRHSHNRIQLNVLRALMTREIISQWYECMFTLNLCKCRQVRHCVEQLSILWSPKEWALLLPATALRQFRLLTRPGSNCDIGDNHFSNTWPISAQHRSIALPTMASSMKFNNNIFGPTRVWYHSAIFENIRLDNRLETFFPYFFSLMITSCWRDFFSPKVKQLDKQA